jgi:tRNA(Ile)-lysidine synthase
MLQPGKFRDALIANCGLKGNEPVLLAVSGGLDSVVLVDLCIRAEVPIGIAHINYGLRDEESNRDERFVAELAAKNHLPFFLLRSEKSDFKKGSIQEKARRVRYNFLKVTAREHGFAYIAVAHHADDSIETVLMNLARGTGVTGLTGIRFVNDTIIRPLLSFSRLEILKYAEQRKLNWCEDSSNETDKYTRNRFRHHLLPWLTNEIPQGYKGFQASMNRMRETESLIEASLAHWEKRCCSTNQRTGTIQINRNELLQFPDPLLFLRFYLRGFGFSDSILSRLKEVWDSAKRKELQTKDYRLLFEKDNLFLLSQNTIIKVIPSIRFSLEEFDGLIPKNPWIALIDADAVTDSLRTRIWRNGDKMIPFGMKGHRLVSDILNEFKLPLHEKEIVQVLISGDDIVWVPGYRIAHKYRVKADTKRVYRLRFNTKDGND